MKTAPAGPSSARPDACSTKRSPRQRSTGRRCTSRTRSSISSSSRPATARSGCTRLRRAPRWARAASGGSGSYRSCSPRFSVCWARRRHKPSSVLPSACPSKGPSRSSCPRESSPSRRSIRRPYCGHERNARRFTPDSCVISKPSPRMCRRRDVEAKRMLRIGTSGWQYRDWRDRFYPQRLAASRWLEYYATRFDTVEVNNTFYRLPAPKTFADWAARVPDGFEFAIKASRYLTHYKRLHEPEEPVERLMTHAAPLRARIGVVLLQLPPDLKCAPSDLD